MQLPINTIEFKKKVLDWLAANNIFPTKVRVYDTRRYGVEVRIYHASMEYVSSRVSFRTQEIIGNQKHGTRGHHTIKTPLYTPINEENMATEEERQFTLQCLKDNL